jgi:hypothetical protein
MTLWDLIRSLTRRWPVVLAGALVTLAAVYWAAQDRGVYWTRTEVVFLAPPSEMYPNSLDTTSGDLIVTAGLVAKLVSGPHKVIKFTSPDAGLIGEGVRRGWAIRLPDTGGQWAPNFTSQLLIVEVIGPDPAEVEGQKNALVRRIATTLDDYQHAHGVAPVNRITSTPAPQGTINYMVTGSRIRTVAMTGALGIGATLGALLLLAHRDNRRRQLSDLQLQLTRVA